MEFIQRADAREIWDSPDSAFEQIYGSIIMVNSFETRLTAFLDYEDFLTFMEEEYENLGSPEEFREVMEIFRTVGTKLNDMRSLISGHDVKLRETIRQERVQKQGTRPSENEWSIHGNGTSPGSLQ